MSLIDDTKKKVLISNGKTKEEHYYVKLPHDKENEKGWKKIVQILSDREEFTTIDMLVKTIKEIMECNGIYFYKIHDFVPLKLWFKEISPEDKKNFLENITPFIRNLVISSSSVFENFDIDFFTAGTPGVVVLSREQCATILSNMFFCTFRRTESCFSLDVPSINLDMLFCEERNTTAKIAKIHMFYNYFCRIYEKMPEGWVIFKRQKAEAPDFSVCKNKMVEMEVSNDTIENCKKSRQMDFANSFIGGGSLSYGCVQEEILFSLRPELNVARLFNQSMGDHESIVIKGAEQFSSYTGYGRTLAFGGNYIDDNKSKTDGRIMNETAGIDAICFNNSTVLTQWKKKCIDRELKKAFVGFVSQPGDEKYNLNEFDTIATGNWGCGAFSGNRQLKCVIQWIAASVAGKKIIYHPFNDNELADGIKKLVSFVTENNITVDRVYKSLLNLTPKASIPDTFQHLLLTLTKAQSAYNLTKELHNSDNSEEIKERFESSER